ncbi:hypothetical protein [Bacillus sp. REN3]|nr:hypothetical protein [Bacillus sp. REN3]
MRGSIKKDGSVWRMVYATPRYPVTGFMKWFYEIMFVNCFNTC